MSGFIWLFLGVHALAASLVPTAEQFKAQAREDYGACTVIIDPSGMPAAELKIYQTRDCADRPTGICSLIVRCEGGVMLPPEVAATATLHVSCPVLTDVCPKDPMDCFAAPTTDVFAGARALAKDAPSFERPRGDVPNSRGGQ